MHAFNTVRDFVVKQGRRVASVR